MNVDLPGFPQGQQWPYDEAPAPVKKWYENKSILFETKICSIVKNKITELKQTEESGTKIVIPIVVVQETIEEEENKDEVSQTQDTKESGITETKEKKEKKYNSTAPKCKGVKSDGYPCRTTKLLDNGYCRHHKDQANQNVEIEQI